MANEKPIYTQSRQDEEDESILPELAMAISNVPIAPELEKSISPTKKDSPSVVDQEIAGVPHRENSSPNSSPSRSQYEHVYPTLSRASKIAIPLLCMSGTFQQASSSVGISLGIKLVGEELHIPEYQLQWLQSSVSLAYACTLLLFGRCADIWGHKIFFISGLIMAGVFNLASGLAQTSMQMFVFRALTGAMFAW